MLCVIVDSEPFPLWVRDQDPFILWPTSASLTRYSKAQPMKAREKLRGGAHGSRPNQAAEKTCFPSPPDSLSFVCAFSAPPYSACLCLPFHAFFQAMLPASHYAFPCQTYGTSCGSPLLLCPCVPELSAIFSKARPCSWALRHTTCESPSPSELSLGGRRGWGAVSRHLAFPVWLPSV